MNIAKEARYFVSLVIFAVLFGQVMPMSFRASSGAEQQSIEDIVPDAATAEKIAEVIFVRFYGIDEISMEKPFTTQVKDGVWIVEGNLPRGKLGGVAEIHISRKDGRVLYLFHGR